MTVVHLGHSELPTRTATGPPIDDPVPHAAGELDLVLLELHPGAAAVAEPTPAEIARDIGGRHRDARRQAVQDGDEGRAVRLARSDPTQHAASLSEAATRDSKRAYGARRSAITSSAPTISIGPNATAVFSVARRVAIIAMATIDPSRKPAKMP